VPTVKTVIIQCYRTRDVPSWIVRCLASVKAWAVSRRYDYRLTDDSVFSLCGKSYLAKVGDNKRSITNLCRLELIRRAHAEGYERAIWVDADVFVFDRDNLDFPAAHRIMFPRETWVFPTESGWGVRCTLNNCVVVCPAGDPDLDLIIETIRHVARHHEVRSNFQLGIELIRGLHTFLLFDLLPNVGMFSNHVIRAIAQNDERVLGYQASYHETPVHAANLSASDHVEPVVPERVTQLAMDILERTRGAIINVNILGDNTAAEAMERSLQAKLASDGVCVLATPREANGEFHIANEELQVVIQSRRQIDKAELTSAIRGELSGSRQANVWFVADFPRDALGKIDRTALKLQILAARAPAQKQVFSS
jgi:hypothetical protein